MSSPHRLVVSVWEPSRAAGPLSTLPDPRYKSSALIGVLVTVIMHTLILLSVLWNVHSVKATLPELSSRTRVAGEKEGPSVELMMMVSPLNALTPQEYGPFVATDAVIPRDQILADARAALPSFELDLPDAEDQTPGGSSDGDARENSRAQWKGIYSGQMKARIERAWERPRTRVNEGSASASGQASYFSCQVVVRQDHNGKVEEILLASCNGSWKWQQSLVLAIQRASPLPAPPDASVFSDSVNLSFVGYDYANGMPEDEYEQPAAPGSL